MRSRFLNKYILLCFATALFYSSYSFAQKSEDRFIPNIHAGLAGSQVDGDGLGGFDKLGFQFGLGIHTELNDHFDIGFELDLVQKGSIRRPDPENNDYEKYKMALLYAEVPVFLRYNVNDKIAFLAGPAFGVLLSAKESDFDGSIPTDPLFNTFELSGILEFQYSFTERWRAGIRSERSLLPIRTKGDTNYNYLSGKQYNMVLGIYVYYTIK